MDMQKVFVFLPRATVRTCAALAARYGSSRSEVLRLAVRPHGPFSAISGARMAMTSVRRIWSRRRARGWNWRPAFGCGWTHIADYPREMGTYWQSRDSYGT